MKPIFLFHTEGVVAALDNKNFQRFRRYKIYHRSVRPRGLTSHRYFYGPSAKYLEEGVRGNSRGRLRNTRVLGILRSDKKKRIGSREQLSCNQELRMVSWNREPYVRSRKLELLINFFGTLHVLHQNHVRVSIKTQPIYGDIMLETNGWLAYFYWISLLDRTW